MSRITGLDTNMQWYVLRVAANKEVQVKDALAQKVEREGEPGA